MPLNFMQRGERWLKEDGTPTDRFAELIEELIREVGSMTTNAKLIATRPVDAAITKVYTSPTSQEGGRGTIITQFSATDPLGAEVYDVYIGSVADSTTKVIEGETAPANGIAPSSLINQLVMPGDSIFVQAGAGNTIVFYASGTERR
jgi:hypothetical protein